MKRYMYLAMASAVALAAAIPANAAIFIGVSVNGGAISNVANDGGTGTVNYNTTSGNFTYNVGATGSPTLAMPNLLTQSVNIKNNNGAAQTVSVYITQTDLTTFNGSLLSSFTSNLPTNSSTTIRSFYSTANALWTGTQLQTATFPANGTFSGANTINGVSPFSTTVRYDITFNAGQGGNFNGTANLTAAVPETATWAMMLMGFGGIGFALRQRRSANVTFA